MPAVPLAFRSRAGVMLRRLDWHFGLRSVSRPSTMMAVSETTYE
jgi:hypothetical protein